MAMTPELAFKKAVAISHKYTDDEVAGGGAIKGKNCIIKTISLIPGGHRVTFEWTLDNGTVQTDTMDVMDGTAGDLEDIADVDIDNLADGQILQYNATSGNWENVSPGSVDTSLEDLKDVDFDNLSDGQIIIWDATNQKWVNSENTPTITVDNEISSTSENPVQNKVIKSALDTKVDKVVGKGLSTNDYTTTDKEIVSGVTSALNEKVDKVNGKGLSTNDYDDTAKTKLEGLVNIKSIGTGLNLNSSTGELSATGAPITIDDEMSNSSTNPVQNKVITEALNNSIGTVTDTQWTQVQSILT